MKRSLFVGINAYPSAPLYGCLDDVATAHALTAPLGYTADARTLRDGEATGAAIESGLRWLLAGLKPGDVAFFHYSGHGSWVRDLDGDEPDGRDETLVPVDFDFADKRTWFTDDRVARIIREAGLAPGALFVLNIDACNAGTMQRMAALPHATRYRALPAPAVSVAPVAWWRRALGLGLRSRPFGGRVLTAGKGKVVQLSATTPTELAADAFIGGRWRGAHTWALEACWRPGITYRDLARDMRRLLRREGYQQTPTLYGAEGPRGRVFLAPLV
jgi:hypothetical protein